MQDVAASLAVDEDDEKRFRVFNIPTLEELETALNDEAMYAYSLVTVTARDGYLIVVMERDTDDGYTVDYSDPESVMNSS